MAPLIFLGAEWDKIRKFHTISIYLVLFVL